MIAIDPKYKQQTIKGMILSENQVFIKLIEIKASYTLSDLH